MSDDIHALIGAYALDAVTDTERAQFEQHLLVCGDCRAELAGLRAATASLGASVPETPPPALRDAVLRGISAVRPLPPLVDDEPSATAGPSAPTATAGPAEPAEPAAPTDRRSKRRRRWPATLAAAAAAAAIVIGGISWHPWTASQPTTVSAVQQVLQAPDAHRYVTHLNGATATVVYSPRLGKSVLESKDLPPAPAGHTYQLWYLTAGGAATGAGFLTPSSNGRDRVLLAGNADDAALVGVTIEPAGGSPHPTTKPIMTVELRT